MHNINKNKDLEKIDVVVIGGGPAGMMTAGRAAERGKNVLLIEKNEKLGKKLLISGKGRCNITNACDIDSFLEKFSNGGRALRNVFAQVFNEDLMNFFEGYGVKLKIERGGRVFPESDKSKDILNALIKYIERGKVKILWKETASKVTPGTKGGFMVFLKSGAQIRSEKIVIATGGLSYPVTGSTGDGYKFAKELGHRLIEMRPGLVPLEIEEKWIGEWQGVALRNVKCELLKNGKKIAEKFGEMLFTHFGVSGPIILDLSAEAYDALQADDRVEISINFKPALDEKKIDQRLLREFKASPSKTIKNIMGSLLPKALIDGFLKVSDVQDNLRANKVKKEIRKKLVNKLMDFRLTVKGIRPIEEAIVTRGGLATDEINPKTMESKKVKGLYFAGETIDVDAKTGGYNMQAAFSTGWVAGNNV